MFLALDHRTGAGFETPPRKVWTPLVQDLSEIPEVKRLGEIATPEKKSGEHLGIQSPDDLDDGFIPSIQAFVDRMQALFEDRYVTQNPIESFRTVSRRCRQLSARIVQTTERPLCVDVDATHSQIATVLNALADRIDRHAAPLEILAWENEQED